MRSALIALMISGVLFAQSPPPSAPPAPTKWSKSRARTRKVFKAIGHGTMIGLECVGAGAVLALYALASSQTGAGK